MAYPKHIQQLAELLQQLPGIGPRQALRVAFALREQPEEYRTALTELTAVLGKETLQCALCFRLMEQHTNPHCDICRSAARNNKHILVVEKESDVESFERTGTFDGLYHITGGVISSLDKNPGEKLRLRHLFERIKNHPERTVMEVVIATSNTLEGNQTANYIERILGPLNIKITRLGRGLSTGSEIEYADPLTLEHALKNRK